MPLQEWSIRILYNFAETKLNKLMTMNKTLLFALLAICALWSSCGNNSNNGNGSAAAAVDNPKVTDSTLCQFSNLDIDKQFSYIDEDGDTLYFDNSFSAFWPQIINGKPCPNLQQALFRAMTDSAELNQLDKVTDFLLDPSNYTDYESKLLMPAKSVKDDENKLSTSEVKVNMESMTDRLLTYHLGTYSYLAGAVHGIYAHNYVTYDLQTDKAVTLDDVVADTTMLRTAILRSIKQTYDYDKDDLFIPDNGLLPLPRDFYFDNSVMHVIYQVYEIASYAQGLIDAPIFPYMLKPEEIKRLFTPYGLELIDYTE